jgi:putative FmdB family regulatory protein
VPTYSYKCKNCEHAFDIQQGFADDALKVCPECQGQLIKVFGQVGVSFKGSGFYRTDSASGKGSAGSGSSGSSSGSSSKPAKSGD